MPAIYTINNYGIDILPTDPAFFPANVVKIAQTIDELLPAQEEAADRASKLSCDSALKQAERADTEDLKRKILAGKTTGLEKTPHTDAALAENRRARIADQALSAAVAEHYTNLRDALHSASDDIRGKLATEFTEAADALEAAITAVQTSIDAALERFAGIAAAPAYAATLAARGNDQLSLPWTYVGKADFSTIQANLAAARKQAEGILGVDLPAYLGHFIADNGVTMSVDLMRQIPSHDNEGKLFYPVSLNDGTTITTALEAAAIQDRYKRINLNQLATR